jgi:hypothetical protein
VEQRGRCLINIDKYPSSYVQLLENEWMLILLKQPFNAKQNPVIDASLNKPPDPRHILKLFDAAISDQ